MADKSWHKMMHEAFWLGYRKGFITGVFAAGLPLLAFIWYISD